MIACRCPFYKAKIVPYELHKIFKINLLSYEFFKNVPDLKAVKIDEHIAWILNIRNKGVFHTRFKA
jgi:hypothetical protein